MFNDREVKQCLYGVDMLLPLLLTKCDRQMPN